MNIIELTDKLKTYLLDQVDSIAKTNPTIKFMKPLVTRAINKNIGKIESTLQLITDKDGNIDIEVLMDEMINNVKESTSFNINAPVIGDIEIGGGNIKFNIPMTDNKLLFNTEDLLDFKEFLTLKDE